MHTRPFLRPLIRGWDNPCFKADAPMNQWQRLVKNAHPKYLGSIRDETYVYMDMKTTTIDAMRVCSVAIENLHLRPHKEEELAYKINKELADNILLLLSEVNSIDRIKIVSKSHFLCNQVTTLDELKECLVDFLSCVETMIDVNVRVLQNIRLVF
jgi:hypothetical protein